MVQRKGGYIMAYLIISVLVIFADQFTKYWVSMNIAGGEQVGLLPGIIHLTNAMNTGAAFSMMSGKRWLLIGISAVATVIIIYIIVKHMFSSVGMIGLAFVLGGAVGNLIDRVLFGSVIDMFEVEFFNFAIFNVADIFVTVGGIMFCVYYIVHIGKADGKKKARLASAESALKAVIAPAPSVDDNSGIEAEIERSVEASIESSTEIPVPDQSVFVEAEPAPAPVEAAEGAAPEYIEAAEASAPEPVKKSADKSELSRFVWPKGSPYPVLASEVDLDNTELEYPRKPLHKTEDPEDTFIHSTIITDDLAAIDWENSASNEKFDFDSILKEFSNENDN